jgi:hypothetical protein
VAAVAVVVGLLRHAVEQRFVSMVDSVDLVFVLEMTSRTVVDCCSALVDQAACSPGRTCSERERQMLTPLLADWKGDVDFVERTGAVADHLRRPIHVPIAVVAIGMSGLTSKTILEHASWTRSLGALKTARLRIRCSRWKHRGSTPWNSKPRS